MEENRPGAGRRRTRWLWAAAVAAAVLVIAGVAVAVLRDPSEPVTVGDALTRYREGVDPGNAGGDGGAAPVPGVYVYDTTGSEGVDALTGSTHTYPATSTVTVSEGAGGCLTFRWAPLEQRWDEEVLCPEGDGGWSRAETTLHHSFFGQDETRTSTCDAPGFVPAPGAEAGIAWTCTSEGSGRSGESHAEGTGRVVGTDTVTVDGVDRAALHVRYEDEVTRETAGAGTRDRWYALDRLPLVLREVVSATSASETIIGTVNYHEDYEIVLASWEPRR